MNSRTLLQTISTFVVLLLVLATGPVNEVMAQAGVTYYVDNQTGSDANAGTAIGEPKQFLFSVNGALAAAADGATISVANTGVTYNQNTVVTFAANLTITSTGGTPVLNPAAGITFNLTGGDVAAFTGPFSIASNVTFNAIAAGSVTGGNNLTLTGGVTVTYIGAVGGIMTGAWASASIGTLLYTGAGNFTTGAEFPATGVAILGIRTTGGNTVTLGASSTVTGAFDVDASQTFATGGNILTLNRATAGTNTHDVDGTVSATGTGGISLTGFIHLFASGAANGTLPNVTVNVSGSVTIGDAADSANGPQRILGDVTVTAGALNIYSVVGNTTTTGITGNVTNNGSGIVTIDANGAAAATLRFGGNVSNSGTGTMVLGAAGEADIFNIIGNLVNNGTVTQTATGTSITGAASIDFIGSAASPVLTISGSVTNSPTFTGASDAADGGLGDVDTSGNITFGDAALTVTGTVTNSPNASGFSIGGVAAGNTFNGNGNIEFTTHASARVISTGGWTNSGSGFNTGSTIMGARIVAAGGVASTVTVTGAGTIENSCVTSVNNGDCDINFSVWTGAVTTGSGGVSIAAGATQADILFGAGVFGASDPVSNNSTSGNSNITTAGVATVGALTAAGGNLNFNNAGAFTAGTTIISGGQVTVASTAVTTIGAVTITGGELQIANGAGTSLAGLNISAGTFDYDGAGATLTMNGNFVQSGGAITTAGDTWDINTDMSITGGTRTFGGVSPLTFTGGIAQTLTSSAGVSWTGNMSVTNTSTSTPGLTLAGGNFTVNGTVTFSAAGVGQPTPRVALGAFRLILASATGNSFVNNGGYSTSADTGGIQMTNTAGVSTINGTADFANLEIATNGRTTTMTEGDNGATVQFTMTGLLSLTSGVLETSNATDSATSDELVFNGTSTVKIGAGVFGPNMANGDNNNEFVFTSAVSIVYAGTGTVTTSTTAAFLTAAGTTGINDVTLAIGGTTPTLALGQALTFNGTFNIPAGQLLAMAGRNVTSEGTSFVQNGTVTSTGGVLILDDAVGTAVTGSGILPGVTVTGGTNTIVNATIGITNAMNLNVNGGSVTFTPAAPAALAENIEGDLNLGGGTLTLGGNVTVGQDLHHTTGTLAMGSNGLTVGQDVAAGSHTLGTGALALFTGTGTLTFRNLSAGNPTFTASAGDTSVITVPFAINMFGTADQLTVTNDLGFSSSVSLTRGELATDNGTSNLTFTGNAVSITSNSDLDVNNAAESITFAPASGTLTFTHNANAALKGAGAYAMNGALTLAGTGNLTIPAAFTQTSGALDLGSTSLIVTGQYTQTAGSVTQGAQNITVTGAFVRVAGTFSQTTGVLIANTSINQGATAFAIDNLRYGGGATALLGIGVITVGETLFLDGSGALDITNPGTTVVLALAADVAVSYARGTFDVAPTMAGAITLSAVTGTGTTVIIPALVWPAAATVNTFTVNRAANTQIPGNRTVQNQVSLVAGLLDLDANAFDLTLANSTLTITAGTVEGDGVGDLLFTSTPDVTFNVNANYNTQAGNDVLANAATLASMTVTRSANGANAILTLSGSHTVTGALSVLNNLTIAATLTLQGAFTVTTDTGNFALATAPVFAGVGTLVMNGAVAQSIPAIAAPGLGNITINNAAGVSTSGAVTIGAGGAGGALTMTSGNLTLGGNLTVGDGPVNSTAANDATNGLITFTSGRIITGATFVVILDHENTGQQGFARGLGATGCVDGGVRKLFDVVNGAGNGGVPDRMVFPVCDSSGNYRPASLTFTAPNTLTQGNWVQVRYQDGLPGGANGMPFAATDGTSTAYQVARYAPFSWFVQTSVQEQAGVLYDVELRAAGYSLFNGENIERVRNIRRLAGLSTNFWQIIAASATGNDNYAVSLTEPVSISRNALGLLIPGGTSGTEGTIFTMGLESNMTATDPAAVAVNAGSTVDVNLANVFAQGTPNGSSPLYTYTVTNNGASVSTGAAANDVLTVTGVAAGSTTISVTAKDQLNDERSATVTVTVSAAFAAGSIAAQELSLGGSNTTAAVDLSTVFTGGSAPVAYVVASSDGAVAGGVISGTTVTTTAAGAGSAVLTVTATDATSTVAMATIAVTVNAAFAATDVGSTDVIEGSNATAELGTQFAGGSTAYTYAAPVSAATNVTASITGSTLTATVADAYTAGTTIGTVDVTVVGTDALGDTATFTLTVNVLPLLGDLDGQGMPSANSATITLKHIVGTQSPALTAKQLVAADFDVNTSVNSYDAYQIWLWPATPKSEDAFVVGSRLAFGEIVREGNLLSLPLVIDGPMTNVGAMSFSSLIDPSVATIISVESDSEGWLMQHSISEDGKVQIAAIGMDAPENGVIATINIQVNEGSAQFSIEGEGALNNNPISEIDAIEVIELPGTFTLKGNYPNPFNPSTTIQFDLPETAEVQIQLIDMVGRQVLTIPYQVIEAGVNRSIQLNASALASGAYFYRVIARMESRTAIESGRLTLIK